jgi:predicted PurR-regulated permease PerM
MAISGIPSPFTWGLVAGLSSMLPLFGSALVWVPAVVWLLATGSYGSGIFMLVWGVVVSVSDNILRPLVVGGQTNQNGLLVFLSLLGGTAVFGPPGLFLGPLVVSLTVAVLRVFRRKITPADMGNVLTSPRHASVELSRDL